MTDGGDTTMSRLTPHDWNEHYVRGELPWDSGVPSKELIRVLDAEKITPCRAAELGCGTGTNSIYLASRGFDMTGFDCSSVAVTEARKKAADAKAKAKFVEADLCRFNLEVRAVRFHFRPRLLSLRAAYRPSPDSSRRSSGCRGRARGTWC